MIITLLTLTLQRCDIPIRHKKTSHSIVLIRFSIAKETITGQTKEKGKVIKKIFSCFRTSTTQSYIIEI